MNTLEQYNKKVWGVISEEFPSLKFDIISPSQKTEGKVEDFDYYYVISEDRLDEVDFLHGALKKHKEGRDWIKQGYAFSSKDLVANAGDKLGVRIRLRFTG